ncbi:MAG TPA: hypothetical protein VEF05_18395 [Terriglobales bacterium]|nr:hypothetical protein [Terriglobales bacterium]
MPVVRIVGQLPEGVGDLPGLLRERGFDVETVADAENCSPVSLEISFEECSTEESLNRALALAEGNARQIARRQSGIKYYTDVKDK